MNMHRFADWTTRGAALLLALLLMISCAGAEQPSALAQWLGVDAPAVSRTETAVAAPEGVSVTLLESAAQSGCLVNLFLIRPAEDNVQLLPADPLLPPFNVSLEDYYQTKLTVSPDAAWSDAEAEGGIGDYLRQSGRTPCWVDFQAMAQNGEEVTSKAMAQPVADGSLLVITVSWPAGESLQYTLRTGCAVYGEDAFRTADRGKTEDRWQNSVKDTLEIAVQQAGSGECARLTDLMNQLKK